MLKQLTQLKNSIKLSKDGAKAAYHAARYNGGLYPSERLVCEVSGIQVYLNNEFLAANGRLIAVTTVDAFTAIPMILVDSKFLALGPTTRNFIILHEIGHIQLGHLENGLCSKEENKLRKSYSKKGIAAPNELAADNYAVKILGIVSAIHALNETNNLVERFMSNRELSIRIKAVSSL